MCEITKEMVEKAASRTEVVDALKELFPHYFQPPIRQGDLYSWGTDSDGMMGLVVYDKEFNLFTLVNPLNGEELVTALNTETTKYELNEKLKTAKYEVIGKCYEGEINGPYQFRTWTTKRRTGK